MRRSNVTPCQRKSYIIDGVQFSDREIDVLACVCSGYTLKSIADLLGISENTLRTHVLHIKEKANCSSELAVIERFTKSASDHLIIRKRLDKLLNVQMSYPKRHFVTRYVTRRNAIACSVFASAALLIPMFIAHSDNKIPISYEIQVPNEQMTLPQKDVMNNISSLLDSKQNLNFIVLVGETGIGKTMLTRKYLKSHNFAVKGEIDAESEVKIVQSIENLCFLLCLLDSKNIRKQYFYWLGCSEDEVNEFFKKWDERQMLVIAGDRYQIHDLIQEKGLSYLLSTLPEEECKTKLNEIIDVTFVFKRIE